MKSGHARTLLATDMAAPRRRSTRAFPGTRRRLGSVPQRRCVRHLRMVDESDAETGHGDGPETGL